MSDGFWTLNLSKTMARVVFINPLAYEEPDYSQSSSEESYYDERDNGELIKNFGFLPF